MILYINKIRELNVVAWWHHLEEKQWFKGRILTLISGL